MVKKAVVLAAGKGARLAPITACVPKELLPIAGFPALHHVIAEAVYGGVSEVMLVLSKGKEEIEKYFRGSFSPKGETAVRLCEEREKLLEKIKVSFAYQAQPLGTGDAILAAKEFAAKDPIFVLYPDDLLGVQARDGFRFLGSSDFDPIRKMFGIAEKGESVVLVREVPGKDAKNYGVVHASSESVEDEFVVRRIEEKPPFYRGERANVLVGRMILAPSVIKALAAFPRRDDVGVIPALNSEAEKGSLVGVIYRGGTYDLGSHESYYSAVKKSAVFLER